jgi:hypothetical protein
VESISIKERYFKIIKILLDVKFGTKQKESEKKIRDIEGIGMTITLY